MQMIRMEDLPTGPHSSIADMHPVMVGPISSVAAPLAVSTPNESVGLVEHTSLDFQNASINNRIEHMESTSGYLRSQPFPTPYQQVMEVGAVSNNLGNQKSSSNNKRKAEEGSLHNGPVSQQSIPNKRMAQGGTFTNLPVLPHPSTLNKRSGTMQSKANSPGSQNVPSDKKMVRNESNTKSGLQRVHPRSRSTQIEPASKVQNESSGAVRPKMRESLASALALAYENEDKIADGRKVHSDIASGHQEPVAPQPSETVLPAAGGHDEASVGKSMAEAESNQNITGFQRTDGTVDEEVSFTDSFFVKDELLQGNGLTWAMDVGMGATAPEDKDADNTEKSKIAAADDSVDTGEQARLSLQNLAAKIEAELFKLFGGVNKKYKEKGRSLLFNLKDRSNPELRERVISGEISPDKLCSMTAEELASKELSKWRMEKAEEFAQMVVLPDRDVDIRRLVKKTHKGEYQVEVEQDDGIAMEVSAGTNSVIHFQSKPKEVGRDDDKGKENGSGQKSSLENQDVPTSLIIPTDGADPMQGMIVDEFKDADFLPPIVSLDEFMECLDSEPPFDNLSADQARVSSHENKVYIEDGNKTRASDLTSRDQVVSPSGKAVVPVVQPSRPSGVIRSKEGSVDRKLSHLGNASPADHVWEGVLQLNISSSIKVVGLFRSGEKTSAKEWPGSVEIKGRVRLDAFEKFLQELPMSRSRAVMVLQMSLKFKESESERASVREAVDSYVLEERLGFAEPVPSVELYLCPCHSRILDMLSKYLIKDCTNMHNSTDNDMIGVVVWRRPHHVTSSISPNASSHQKHMSKKQHLTSSRQQENDARVNPNLIAKVPLSKREPSPDDDDDIPPGFGPKASSHDDDDLPEFNFSNNVNQQMNLHSPSNLTRGTNPQKPENRQPHRPVDQIRELIHRYGQNTSSRTASAVPYGNVSGGLGIEPWNDDDDIPEWRPQLPQPLQPPVPGHQHPMNPHGARQLGQPAMLPMQSIPNIHQSTPSWHGGARPIQSHVPFTNPANRAGHVVLEQKQNSNRRAI